MRVSERNRYGLAEKRVEHAKDANARMLDELSTQKTIREISDDPIGMSRALRYKDRISRMDQNIKNLEFSKGFLAKTEFAIADLGENLMRAKELAIGMANDTYGPDSREATGREVAEILKEVVQLGNAQYNGKFVFGGFRTSNPPLSVDGDFIGDDGAIFLEMTEGDFKQINVQARSLFEANLEDRQVGHFNMVHAVEMLHDGLMSNDKQLIQKSIAELDYQLDKTSSYQASLGGLTHALDQTQARVEKDRDFSKAGLSSVQDSDTFHATSEFKRTETILQSTLLATNKMLQPSLLNFMQ